MGISQENVSIYNLQHIFQLYIVKTRVYYPVLGERQFYTQD
jgi:hypothetical protein